MKTSFLGYELHGQIVAASCPATENFSSLIDCRHNGAAMAILKTASSTRLNQSDSNGGRHCLIDKQGFWAKSTFNREIMHLNEELELLKKSQKELKDMPLIASVTELELNIDKWLEDCYALEKTVASAIQLDLFYIENLLAVPDFEKKFINLLKEIVNHVKIPVMPKLNIGLPAEYSAYLFKKAGIRYVSLLDSIKSPAPLNFTSEGQPSVDKNFLGSGLSVFGAFMLPITRYYTQVLCREGFEVCAGGGVKKASDIAGLLFLGADTIQIATEVLLHGHCRIRELSDETDVILEKAGLSTSEEIKKTGMNLYNHPVKTVKYHAHWKYEKCPILKDKKGCSHFCCNQEFCSHISVNDSKCSGSSYACKLMAVGLVKKQDDEIKNTIFIDGNCEGCGLCAQLCPHGAIELVQDN
jgi:dihydroorotate dehydrogenase/ferredoxin